MSIQEVMPELKQWSAEGHACGIAILYRAQHSSPRPVGAHLAVADDGRMAGAISMGCVESDIREHIMDMLQNQLPPKLLHYGAADEFLLEVGLTCGGEIDVLITRCDPTDAVWAFLNERAGKIPCLMATVITGSAAGSQWCVTADDQCEGSLQQGEYEVQVRDAAADFMAHKRSSCLTMEDGERVFVQYVPVSRQLAIVGGNPIAVALCDQAARLGFEVTVIDPRKAVAPHEYYPLAKQVIHEWPEAGMQVAGVDAMWYVAVLSHDQKLDVPALETALRLNCSYVGLLGSSGTRKKRLEELRDHGVAQEQLDTIYGPIGLKAIGAVTSPEIAVSIMAQMIAHEHHAPLAAHSVLV